MISAAVDDSASDSSSVPRLAFDEAEIETEPEAEADDTDTDFAGRTLWLFSVGFPAFFLLRLII
jgi:hypothetical protein